MEDISKGTVTLLLILAVLLTAVLSWKIMTYSQQVVIDHPDTKEVGGKLSVGIYPEGELPIVHPKRVAVAGGTALEILS